MSRTGADLHGAIRTGLEDCRVYFYSDFSKRRGLLWTGALRRHEQRISSRSERDYARRDLRSKVAAVKPRMSQEQM